MDQPNANRHTSALTVLTLLFFMWGLITSLNDILVPHLKAVFTLSYVEASLIQFCFFTAYFIMSFPAGRLVEKVGYKSGIIVGLATAGFGCLLFYPAAGARSYPFFLGALFILASGITLLQVAANPYVNVLGRPETAASRLNLTQAFNSLGTTVGPLIGSVTILAIGAGAASQIGSSATNEADSVQLPYLVLAGLLFAIAALIALFRLPKIEHGAPSDGAAAGRRSLFAHRHLIYGVIGIFAYVGAEVSIGSYLVSLMGQPEIAGLPAGQAGKYLSLYWGGAMLGRFIGSALMHAIPANRMLAFNALVNTLLIAVALSIGEHVAMWSLILIGLFNSIMFPTIFSLALEGLGNLTSKGSGLLCMAIVGGAVMPLVQAFFADRIGLLHSFAIPLLCYLYIAWFGAKGYRADEPATRHAANAG
ncbi:sugar MFS transporter [Pseudomonas sp. ZM23]|uniref:Sugar MFS transporter n=1 Tax=Pseudomonas triclosanedens TaxID=2961893 RepID=A0ABY6ZU34_9PSED|nr:sugar MFS transporter [Pseudomonas triclosanedens]MCP8467155.1 sugar MFS transporter [Pseudomonas triclosanedens]MCP8472696.1 sugar MFS transporter [Pseudomonas triclosanedens]MCP8478127.1 sugar MFS transporter [Pseudomonas triclosanedens]WAI47535.1 sugar MFS transporter [Pseudomonas triclosanedens]